MGAQPRRDLGKPLLSSFRPFGGRTIGIGLAALAAIAAAAVAVFVLYPRGSNSLPGRVQGDLSAVSLAGPQLRAQACQQEIGRPAELPTAADRAAPERPVSFRFAIQVPAGSKLPVRWSVRHAASSRLVNAAYTRKTGIYLQPLGRFFQADSMFCVPVPRQGGQYFVDLQLLYGDSELDRGRTGTFPGAPRPQPPPSPAPPPSPPPPPPPPAATIIG